MAADAVRGRLVLDDRVAGGRIAIDADGLIAEVVLDPEAATGGAAAAAGAASGAVGVIGEPYITPGFVDVHVHGWGGHHAMGGPAALDGMARSLLRHGVTSFLPTAVTAPLDALGRFAQDVRDWTPRAPADGAEPLGFNLEGPFLARSRHGAHDPAMLREPADVSGDDLEPLFAGLRLLTLAPELRGALELTRRLRDRGTAVSIGHSEATLEQARAGYAAGATSTTHLFNAMSGLDHRAPGAALAALLEDDAFVELIADGIHVHPALWELIIRLKPAGRFVLVSDALSLAGTGDGHGRIGGLEVDVVGDRATLTGTTTLAGSVIALDTAVRNLVVQGTPLPAAVAAASRNPLALLGISDRGRIAVGRRADLVELDDDLEVRRVMRGGDWVGSSA